MNEAKTTWALIVGIDEYDVPQEVPSLQGAVADALAAYLWLRRLGVPDAQILMHASPSPAIRPDLEKVRPGYLPARSREIDDSIVKLETVEETEGTRLFLFLFGHGLFEPTSGRLFLTQEFYRLNPTNIGLDRHVPRLLATSFKRQFLFMDGCQNLPYSSTERQQFAGGMANPRVGFTPREDNGLILCCAASQGQLANELGGRGLFSRHLFDALDLDRPWPGAVDLDFEVGARTIDLHKLFYDHVRDKVKDEAWAQPARNRQIPQLDPRGSAQAMKSYPIVSLPDVAAAKVRVQVDPAGAEPAIEDVRIYAERPRHWMFFSPKEEGTPVPLPLESRLPLGLTITARCSLRPGAPWDLAQASYDWKVVQDHTFTFQLQPKSPPPPPWGTPPSPDSYGAEVMRSPSRGTETSEASTTLELRTVAPDGSLRYNQFSYDEVRRSLGSDLLRDDEVAPGVRIRHHEHGPDFVVRPEALRQGYDVAHRWAKAIERLTPREVRVTFEVQGAAEREARPNLRLVLPPGGAASLGGFVAGRPVVWIGLPGKEPAGPLWREEAGPGQRSLVDLEWDPDLHVAAGPVRIRLELPWGNWTSLAQVPESGEARVTLPDTVGTPPLRVALAREAGRKETLIVGAEGEAPPMRLRPGLRGRTETRLRSAEPVSAAWALQPPRQGGTSRQDLAVVDLGEGRRALFPLFESRALALDLSGGGLRVEALSPVPSPAWDLLLADGRLDALDPEDTVSLARGKWVDWLLGLAGAYAVYARPTAHRPDYLTEILRNLTRVAENQKVPDLDLLRAALEFPGAASLDPAAVRRLLPWAKKGAVPVLRWGVALAVHLLRDASDERLAAWRDDLTRIEPRLSPISVWTAWTE